MPVTFHIPGALRELTAGKSRVEIESSPTTLAEALAALWILYPGVRDRIETEQGQMRQHINIFIGDENVRYTGGLASPIPPGAEISIVPAVSGGSMRRDSRPRLSVERSSTFFRCKKESAGTIPAQSSK
jgi:molybdopterin converting factor small subunit